MNINTLKYMKGFNSGRLGSLGRDNFILPIPLKYGRASQRERQG